MRRLHHDRIGHAIVGAEEVGRRDLRTSRQIDDHAVGDIARGQAEILRARAVDIDIESRIVRRLLNARVGDTGNETNAPQQIVGIFEIGFAVGPTHLQIDRRRCTEIQNLADDIGRQERKRDAGEFARQLLAQLTHILRCRAMAFAQLDLDVAVLRTDHAGVVVGHVDAADRHADVVGQRIEFIRRNDLADRPLHVGEMVRRLLDTGTDLLPRMDQDLAGIDRGKEVAAEERHQQERQGNAGEESGDEDRTMAQRQREDATIAGAETLEPRLEAALEPDQWIARRRWRTVMMFVPLQQILRHRRHQRARQDERPDHGEHHRQRHRHEQEPRDARQEEHRHEHDADAQQRDEGRRHDLPRAVEDGGFDLLALLQMPVDVFDRHRRVVDQDADRQRQTAQRHDVQRLANQRQHDDSAEHGERDRDCDDQRRAPAAEEQEDHHAGQKRRDHALECHTGDGAAHEDRLIAEQPDLQVIRQGVANFSDLLLDAVDDVERRHRPGLQHHHEHRATAIDVDNVGLRRIAVAHLSDVADVDGGAICHLDRQIAELVDLQRRVVELNVVFELADLLRADRRDQILRRQCTGDILRGKAPRLQRRRIKIDLDLALLAAERPRDRRPRYGDQRRAQLVGGDVEQVLLGQPLAGQRQLDDRHRRGAVVEDQRRRRTRRQLLDHGLRDGGDLRIRGADIDVGLEENLDNADAVIGIGDDMLDVVDGGGQRALERRGDAPRHLVRWQAGVGPDHADHRDADVRENVRRCPQCGERPNDEQQQREHHERIRAGQRDPDKRYHRQVCSSSIRPHEPVQCNAAKALPDLMETRSLKLPVRAITFC